MEPTPGLSEGHYPPPNTEKRKSPYPDKQSRLFWSRLAPFKGKKASDQKRIGLACSWIRAFIWAMLPDEGCRAAVTVAEDYAAGKSDKNQLTLARKGALKAYRETLKQIESADRLMKQQAAQLAYLVTLLPFSCAFLQTVGLLVANTVVWSAFARNPKKVWWWHFEKLYEPCMGEMANALLSACDTPTRQVMATENNDYADAITDSRFQHPRIEIRISGLLALRVACSAEFREAVKSGLRAYAQCEEKKIILPADIQQICRVAESPVPKIREMGIQMLLLIGQEFECARDSLLCLLSHPASKVRFSAISSFAFYRFRYPKEFVLKMIEKALEDISWKVRQFASQAASGYSEVKECVTLLMRRLEKEGNEEVRNGLRYDIAMLRDGYRIEKRPNGRYSVSVKTERGINLLELKKKDLDPKRFKKILEQVRSGMFEGSWGEIIL